MILTIKEKYLPEFYLPIKPASMNVFFRGHANGPAQESEYPSATSLIIGRGRATYTVELLRT